MTTQETKHKLNVNFDSYMSSYEKASLSVSSVQSRQPISIYKKHSSLFTEEEEIVWNKLISKETEFTVKEMKLMKEMSKIPYFATERK